MNKYNESKIYVIKSYLTDKIYIGSTIKKYLCHRLGQHIYDYKQYLKTNKKYMSSFEILKYDDYYIELLEQCICNNRNELNKIEGKYIKMYKNKCVNLHITGRNIKERYEDEKIKILNNQKIYVKKNIEKIKEYQKNYNINNHEIISNQQKKYRHTHKDYLNEKKRLNRNLKIKCQHCEILLNKSSLSNHIKRKH